MNSIRFKSFFLATAMLITAAPTFAVPYGGSVNTILAPYNPDSEITISVNNCTNIHGTSNTPYLPVLSPGETAPFGQIGFSMDCAPNTNAIITLLLDVDNFNFNDYEVMLQKVDGSSVVVLTPTTTYTVLGNNSTGSFTYTVQDNGPLDENPAPGIIQDPVIVVVKPKEQVATGGGGGGGFVGGSAGSNINWSNYLAPVVNLFGGNSGSTGGTVLGASTTATVALPAGFVFNKNLWLGSRHADVTKLQQFLINSGYMKDVKNKGFFGVLTFNAVKAYQKKNAISQTGYVGIKTRTAINSTLK